MLMMYDVRICVVYDSKRKKNVLTFHTMNIYNIKLYTQS